MVRLSVGDASASLHNLVTLPGPRLRLSKLTASVHLADVLLLEIAKHARKVFDSRAQCPPDIA